MTISTDWTHRDKSLEEQKDLAPRIMRDYKRTQLRRLTAMKTKDRSDEDMAIYAIADAEAKLAAIRFDANPLARFMFFKNNKRTKDDERE